MRYYHYILLFFVLAVIIRIIYIIYMIKKQIKDKNLIKEGFESLSNCLMQGYPTKFCKRVPLEACVTNCQ
jgi:hypothetical protein